MNPVLEEIIKSGNTKTVEGKIIKAEGQITEDEGRLITQIIKDLNAEISVETGLAHGASAMFICEALKKSERTKHYVIDPYQMNEKSYAGIGMNNLKKSGFERIVEFMEMPSHQALTLLEMNNVKVDFAFIDGWHTFDYALIDFFLADKILKAGGVIMLDDADWPAITKVCSFISKNCSYEFIGGTPQRSYLKKNNSGNILKKIQKHFSGEDGTGAKLYGAMAFKKISDDKRRWDHFENF